MIASVLDTETTGLVANRMLRLDRQIELIEFYGCTVDLATGEIQNEIETLLKPERAITEEIIKITNITNEMVKDAPRFKDRADAIKQWLEAAPLLIAHNMAFDRDAIELEFERIGQTVKWPPLLCTVEQTIHLKGHRLKLGDLHELLMGTRFADAHRGKTDTLALVRCCCKLFERGDI